jgi:membrane fusion protein (multidrug efflux system)
MFARGAVVVQESPDAVLIPKDAVVERAGETLVFVVDGGVAERRDVQIGLTDEQSAEVLSGVAAGESVVIVGAQGLRDGDPVLIRQSEEL